MPSLRNVLFVAGRTVVGTYLLRNAVNHFQNVDNMVPYAKSKGVDAPHAAVLASGALLATGGISILTGWRPKIGLTATALFFLTVTPQMHAFWKLDNESIRQSEEVNFTKNLALLGAITALAAIDEPWPASLGGRRKRDAAHERAHNGHLEKARAVSEDVAARPGKTARGTSKRLTRRLKGAPRELAPVTA